MNSTYKRTLGEGVIITLNLPLESMFNDQGIEFDQSKPVIRVDGWNEELGPGRIKLLIENASQYRIFSGYNFNSGTDIGQSAFDVIKEIGGESILAVVLLRNSLIFKSMFSEEDYSFSVTLFENKAYFTNGKTSFARLLLTCNESKEHLSDYLFQKDTRV